jgi:spermidine synthase
VCGAAVLSVELLGTRVIAPFYGSSLYLWSALISVTLAALSLGYAIGGRLADKNASLSTFCLIIAAAGVWIACIPLLRSPVLIITESLGLRSAVLVTATLLFFPPLALLGMISPYAIRLKALTLGEVGRTAGNLYAVSTLASVAAALTTGFILIPNIGVSRLVFVIGLVLVVTALIGLVYGKKWQGVALPVILCAAAAIFLFGSPVEAARPEIGLMAIEESPYAEIRVVDQDNSRYMVIDGGIHTIVDPTTWQSLFSYVNVLDVARGMFAQPGRALVVGLGGGSVVKNFHRYDWKVEAVEIDGVVTKIAREYFGLTEKEADVYEMDARQFFISYDKTYDLIVMDAFGSSSIPFHLVTEEAFALVKSRLAAEGVLAMNVEGVGWRDQLVVSLAATAQRSFKFVTVLPIAEPPDKIGNLILIAADRPIELLNELPVPLDRFSAEYDQAHAWDNRFIIDTTGVLVLTDELNPVEVWAERINLVARKDLHNFFKQPGVAW